MSDLYSASSKSGPEKTRIGEVLPETNGTIKGRERLKCGLRVAGVGGAALSIAILTGGCESTIDCQSHPGAATSVVVSPGDNSTNVLGDVLESPQYGTIWRDRFTIVAQGDGFSATDNNGQVKNLRYADLEVDETISLFDRGSGNYLDAIGLDSNIQNVYHPGKPVKVALHCADSR